RLIAAALCIFATVPAAAEGERAGRFDYFVLSLSWSPGWCAREGDGRGAPECAAGAGRGFGLHGLWPQHEIGWPSFCRTSARAPSKSETAAMADAMGSSGLAWHQWKKHGSCSGLSGTDYFALSRRAFATIRQPAVFSGLDRDLRLPARVVEDAFIEANPALERNMITVTCAEGRVAEVRICLDRGLTPRACGEVTVRDCRITDALMDRLR